MKTVPGMAEKLLDPKRISVDAQGCFNWKGSLNENGYGLTRLGNDRRTKLVPRLSFAVFRRPIPKGLCVLHRCDNPRCINPAHLFLGTHKDNSQDMARKDRCRFGDRVNTAKLTNDKVRQICRRYNAGETTTTLSAEFGISPQVTWKVLTGRSWTRVTRESVVLRKDDCGRPGEGNPAAKLTEDQVLAIRRSGDAGATYTSIAKKYNVCISTISQICRRQTWAHLPK